MWVGPYIYVAKCKEEPVNVVAYLGTINDIAKIEWLNGLQNNKYLPSATVVAERYMFSQACVKNSARGGHAWPGGVHGGGMQGGVYGGGMHGSGACAAGGHVW